MTALIGTSSNSTPAVEGDNTGGGYGVKAVSNGTGVYAQTTGNGAQGLYANSGSASSWAIYAEAPGDCIGGKSYATSNGIGMYGWAYQTGLASSGNVGVMGLGDTYGVQGTTINGVGVYGTSAGSGTYAIKGVSTSNLGIAVYGSATTGNNSGGGYFVGDQGISVKASGGASNSHGVYAWAAGSSTNAAAVYALNTSTSTSSYGLYGSSNGYGIFATSTNWAGYFQGLVYVSGGISCLGNSTFYGYIYKSGGGYQIDHPSDPGNKTLNHCFVESPEMLNVYRGRVVFNNDGNATATLPSYFGDANELPEYILTPIGAAMPNLHVSEEISSGSFKLSGGVPGKSASWQVTSARADKWAKANHPGVEVTKKQPGTYLHPELFGFDQSKHVDAERRHDVSDETKNATHRVPGE